MLCGGAWRGSVWKEGERRRPGTDAPRLALAPALRASATRSVFCILAAALSMVSERAIFAKEGGGVAVRDGSKWPGGPRSSACLCLSSDLVMTSRLYRCWVATRPGQILVSQAQTAWTSTKELGRHSSTRPTVNTKDNRLLSSLEPSSFVQPTLSLLSAINRRRGPLCTIRKNHSFVQPLPNANRMDTIDCAPRGFLQAPAEHRR